LLLLPVELAGDAEQALDGGAWRERAGEGGVQRHGPELGEGQHVLHGAVRDGEAAGRVVERGVLGEDQPQGRVGEADRADDGGVGRACPAGTIVERERGGMRMSKVARIAVETFVLWWLVPVPVRVLLPDWFDSGTEWWPSPAAVLVIGVLVLYAVVRAMVLGRKSSVEGVHDQATQEDR
jgi:hypothetical protein